MTRATTRLAVGALKALVIAAGLAPWLANEHPLLGMRGTLRLPAAAHMCAWDWTWVAVAIAVAGSMLPRNARRGFAAAAALALCVVVFVLIRTRDRPPWSDDDARAASVVVRAPILHGFHEHDFRRRFEPPTREGGYWLGGDALGRDVRVRLLYGLRASLTIGFFGAAGSLALGLLLGAASGFGGRVVGRIGSWIVQAGQCFPALVVAVGVAGLARLGVAGLTTLLAALRAPYVARLVRQETLRVREAPFVLAARGLGLHPLRIAARHILPHVAAPALVASAFAVGSNILAEAGLSFLGLGLREPSPSLGELLQEGRESSAPALIFAPGIAICLIVLACQSLAESARETLDPKGAEAVL